MSEGKEAVDLVHLDRYTGGNRATNEEILLLFENHCRESLERLEQLVGGEPNVKTWREITHTLKGAARGVGAFALGEAAAAAEKAENASNDAIAAIQRLKANAAAVYLFIQQFVKRS